MHTVWLSNRSRLYYSDTHILSGSVRYGVAAILRRWSDVSLKDATDGKRKSNGKGSRGDRSEVLKLQPGKFASLFVTAQDDEGRPIAS